MPQVLIRDVSAETIDSFKTKAKLNGRSLEQELRGLMESNRQLTPAERYTLSQSYLAQYDREVPSLTLDEIRDGLE